MVKSSRLLVVFFAFALSILAQNLIPNPMFKDGANENGIPTDWRADTSEGVRAEYGVVQENGRNCFRIQRLTEKKPQTMCRISTWVDQVVPGATYFFSVDVKNTDTIAEAIVYEFDTHDKNKPMSCFAEKQNQDWQTIRLVFQTSPLSKRFKISLIAQTDAAPVFFTNVQLLNIDEPPKMMLHQFSAAPKLDADGNAAIWQEANRTSLYFPLGTELKALPKKSATSSLIGYYNGVLHILTIAKEPYMNERVTSTSGWGNDTIEVFLRDMVSGMKYHLGVTATGEQLSELANTDSITGFAVDWYSTRTVRNNTNAKGKPLTFQSAISQQEDSWTAQFAILLDQEAFRDCRKFQILLARSRKTSKGSQNSSWGRTASTFFKDSEGFATLTLPVDNLLDKVPALPPQPASKPIARIVPTPQQTNFTQDIITWKPPLKVYSNVEKTFQAAKLMLETQLHTTVQKATSPTEANLVLNLSACSLKDGFDKLADWQHAEAYTLTTGKRSEAVATTHRGLVYAVASMAQLMCYDDQGNLTFLAGTIKDWPSLKFRGWHFMAPEKPNEVPQALRLIDTLAALKFNWCSIQIDNRFTYERNPAWGAPNAPSKEQHRQLGERIDLYGIDVIPMTQCFSHFSYFLKRPEYRHLAEVQNPSADSRHKYWNYCPRHPEIHKYVFDMIEEHLECYPKAKWYHVGLDEITFEPIGVCDRCKGTPGGVLLAEEIQRLHDFVTAKGLRMCMWCDQLETIRNGGKKPYLTAEALPKVPRDILIFDWHYNEGKNFPMVAFFKKEGFDVIGAGWFLPENHKHFIDEIFLQNVLGYGGTSWVRTESIRNHPHLMTAIPIAADRSWKQDDSSLETLAYQPAQLFQRVFDGISPRQPVRFKPLPLTDIDRTPAQETAWMGIPVQDKGVSVIPTGLNWFQGIPFQIEGAFATAASLKEFQNFPNGMYDIPVGGQVQELCFLHTATRPNPVIRTMYDRSKQKPRCIGYYVIHYADHSTLRIPLQWEENIIHWNAQIPSSYCKTAWTGKTKTGAILSLEAFRWKNPKPEVPITTIDLLSNKDKAAPVLLGITATISK
ncbi:MAG: family 20 glycosylhydrolase [Victivallales bacterium]|nr:family 20 glycosylhydrolase [Victivallales bacterium]